MSDPTAPIPDPLARSIAPHNYLFALNDGGGTVPPELGIARRLVDRGHRVTVLADQTMATEVVGTGATFEPWTESWGQFQDSELRTPRSMLRGMVDNMFLGPAPAQVIETRAAIVRLRPDLVLTSFPAIGGMIAAEASGVPFDVMLPNVYGLPATGMPPFGAGLRPATGPLGRLRDAIAGRASTALFDRYALERVNALRAEHGLDPVAHSWDQLHHARRELVLTSAAFDFPATLPPNARYVGPVLDDPTWAADDDWEPPTGEGPLVLVALSSTFQDQAECLQRIADALGTLPVRGLISTGPAIAVDAIRAPANVTVVASVPHSAALRVADLVITHGGHGTVIKTLAAGLPMILVPHGRDQADNAIRVTMRGAGVTVPRRAASKRVAEAITEVLGAPRYREAAARLGRTIADDADGTALLAEVEDLVAPNSAPA
jgi:MGT family glycosyltransferase